MKAILVSLQGVKYNSPEFQRTISVGSSPFIQHNLLTGRKIPPANGNFSQGPEPWLLLYYRHHCDAYSSPPTNVLYHQSATTNWWHQKQRFITPWDEKPAMHVLTPFRLVNPFAIVSITRLRCSKGKALELKLRACPLEQMTARISMDCMRNWMVCADQ